MSEERCFISEFSDSNIWKIQYYETSGFQYSQILNDDTACAHISQRDKEGSAPVPQVMGTSPTFIREDCVT